MCYTVYTCRHCNDSRSDGSRCNKKDCKVTNKWELCDRCYRYDIVGRTMDSRWGGRST